MDNCYTCKRCKKQYDNKIKARRICQECFKDQRHNYYVLNKNRFPNKYIKNNKPVGRPKKIILDDDDTHEISENSE